MVVVFADERLRPRRTKLLVGCLVCISLALDPQFIQSKHLHAGKLCTTSRATNKKSFAVWHHMNLQLSDFDADVVCHFGGCWSVSASASGNQHRGGSTTV